MRSGHSYKHNSYVHVLEDWSRPYSTAAPGALIKKALRAVIVKVGGTSYSKLNASQAMIDAGRAALLEDKDQRCNWRRIAGCTALQSRNYA